VKARHGKLIAALAIVVAGAIAAHRFNPVNWPPLAHDILHSFHGTGFALLAVIVWWLLQRRYPDSFNYLLAAGITMGIGIVSEAAQIPGPRDAQFNDLIVDGLGVFGALGLLAAFDPQARSQLTRPVQVILPTIAGVALGIACVPSVWFSYALVQQHRAFPHLLTFEHAWESAVYSQPERQRPVLVESPANWPGGGGTVARSREAGRWGIFISIKPAIDWNEYSRLSFVVASAGEPIAMDIAVKDIRQKDVEKEQSRFYKAFQAGPEPRRITVTFEEIARGASNGPFDFSKIESIVLSAAKPGSGAEVLLDDFRLEP